MFYFLVFYSPLPVVAHGNFSDENHILLPDVDPPADRVQDDVYIEKVLNKAVPSPPLHACSTPTGSSSSDQAAGADSPAAQPAPPQQPETPISAVEKEDTTYVAVIIGILMAVVIILLVAVFLVYTRSRHRKGFLGALISKTSSSTHHHHQGHHLSSLKKAPSFAGSYGVVKDFEHKSYLVATAGAGGQKSTLLTNGTLGGTLGGTLSSSGVSLPPSGANGDMTHLLDSKCNYYHEPFPFYSYSTVVSELRKNGTPVLNGKSSTRTVFLSGVPSCDPNFRTIQLVDCHGRTGHPVPFANLVHLCIYSSREPFFDS